MALLKMEAWAALFRAGIEPSEKAVQVPPRFGAPYPPKTLFQIAIDHLISVIDRYMAVVQALDLWLCEVGKALLKNLKCSEGDQSSDWEVVERLFALLVDCCQKNPGCQRSKEHASWQTRFAWGLWVRM